MNVAGGLGAAPFPEAACCPKANAEAGLGGSPFPAVAGCPKANTEVGLGASFDAGADDKLAGAPKSDPAVAVVDSPDPVAAAGGFAPKENPVGPAIVVPNPVFKG